MIYPIDTRDPLTGRVTRTWVATDPDGHQHVECDEEFDADDEHDELAAECAADLERERDALR